MEQPNRVIILAGISRSRETNTFLYSNPFRKPNLDRNKAAIEIAGKPLLQRSCENYLEAGLTPVIWGPRAMLAPLLTPAQRERVRFVDLESSLSEKIERLGELRGPVHLATVDIVPTRQDLALAQRAVAASGDADALFYAINGPRLVELGFRKSLTNKLYAVDNGYGRDIVAFPQFWSFDAGKIRFPWMAKVSDELYRLRGWGLLTMPFVVPKIIRTLRRDDDGRVHESLKEDEVLPAVRGLLSNRWYVPGRPPTYEKLERLLSYGLKEQRPGGVRIARNMDAPSLAMDVDWEHENVILDKLYKNEWR